MNREDIKCLIENYLKEVDDVLRSARPFDGILGLGKRPADNPCHGIFIDNVGKAVAEVKDSEEAFAVADELIRANENYDCSMMTSLSMTAAQGHILKLLPLLTSEQKKELKVYFDKHIPKRKRLPVQEELYRALKQN